jgi:hypothetical protein
MKDLILEYHSDQSSKHTTFFRSICIWGIGILKASGVESLLDTLGCGSDESVQVVHDNIVDHAVNNVRTRK